MHDLALPPCRSHRLTSLAAVPWVALAAAGLCSAPGRADFQPNVKPQLEIRPAGGEIRVDGLLDDPGWSGAARATNFVETWPGDNVQPSIGHEAWMTYDEDHLYFAILVEDDPSQIRASLRDRDEIWRDDYVGLILDTYGTGAWAYELFINPVGVQMDLRWTPTGEDMGFDVVFASEATVTATGWQVEVGVPFKSLRFPDRDVQEWRGTFWHNQPRESRNRYSWASSSRDNPCWSCEWGTFHGIEGVSSGGALDLLPSVTALDAAELSQEGDPDSGLRNVETTAEFGLGARYGISSSYSLEGTYNPDFSQVESDAAQIDVNTTFALFFPERRPFFQEGSDLYRTYITAVYTRSVNNPQWAGKLTGRTQRTSVGVLFAQDEDSPVILPFEERSEFLLNGRSWSNIARARRTLYADSYLGGVFTDRRYQGGGSNTVFGADTMMRFWEKYRFEGQVLASHTREIDDPVLSEDLGEGTFDNGRYTDALDGESFWGHAAYGAVKRSARHWNWDLNYTRTNATFRADNGFVTQNDNQRAIFVTAYDMQPDNRWLDSLGPSVMFARVWNTNGVRKDEWIRPEFDFQFKGQTFVEVGFLTSNELFRGVHLNGIQRWSAVLETYLSEHLNGGAYYESGDMVARNEDPVLLGKGTNFQVWGLLKLFSRVSIEPEFSYSRLEDPSSNRELFEGYIVRTRFNVQFSRELFLRLVLQYDEFDGLRDIEPLLSYKINPFTVFYAGSAHRLEHLGDGASGPFDPDLTQTARQYFLKLQVLFRT